MKKILQHSLLALLTGALLLGGTLQSQAHPDGYWDHDGHWHHYEYYHHHHGYWDEHEGHRVWVNIEL
jgi:hypothetical protein